MLDASEQTPTPALTFDNSFARELDGYFVPWQPARVPSPSLLFFNRALAEEIAPGLAGWNDERIASVFSGNTLPEGSEPIAQAYAGHQFGQFSPQLGDGRALLIGEVIDRHGRRRDLAFKGSGRTPFARGGDGKAAIGPMLREALISEAMHALGIPTTRALAVVSTGEAVRRERLLPGAILTRVAASHLRVGSFEFHAARGDVQRLRQLADYTIARHDPALTGASDRYLGLLRAVARRQARLVAQWMNVGFIHGVMNTDNVAISGETIDYGPCAFLDAYDPHAVFSSIDTHRRYAYGQQPAIARWNLARFAESLLPLMADDPQLAVGPASEVIDEFADDFDAAWLAGQRAKLGLQTDSGGDRALALDFLALLESVRVDFTLAYRRLADAAVGDAAPLQALFDERASLQPWLERWQARCAGDDTGSPIADAAARRRQRMNSTNPWIIPRNHRVEEVLAAATDDGDLAPFHALLAAVRRPFDEQPAHERFAEPAAAAFTENYRTFCGT